MKLQDFFINIPLAYNQGCLILQARRIQGDLSNEAVELLISIEQKFVNDDFIVFAKIKENKYFLEIFKIKLRNYLVDKIQFDFFVLLEFEISRNFFNEINRKKLARLFFGLSII